jgi:hypothetical protein
VPARSWPGRRPCSRLAIRIRGEFRASRRRAFTATQRTTSSWPATGSNRRVHGTDGRCGWCSGRPASEKTGVTGSRPLKKMGVQSARRSNCRRVYSRTGRARSVDRTNGRTEVGGDSAHHSADALTSAWLASAFPSGRRESHNAEIVSSVLTCAGFPARDIRANGGRGSPSPRLPPWRVNV